MGLAAETMESFFVQRKRWGRGNIQVGYIIAQEKGLGRVCKAVTALSPVGRGASW
jgi:hypothetical protein